MVRVRDRVGPAGSGGWRHLVLGDNLPVLLGLRHVLVGQAKLVYMDPPYNTGRGRRPFHDRHEEGVWLAGMQERLQLAREVLAQDGYLVVHLDQSELGPALVLVREIFGEQAHVQVVTWQRAPFRTVLGQGQAGMITLTEYVIFVPRTRAARLRRLTVRRRATARIMSQYRLRLWPGTLAAVETRVVQGQTVTLERFAGHRVAWLPAGTTLAEYRRIFPELYQSVSIHKEHTFLQAVLALLDPTALYRVTYVPTRGKGAGSALTAWFLGGRRLLPASAAASVGEDGELYRHEDVGTLWTHDEIPVTGLMQEGGVRFVRGKKPAALLARIVEMATGPGDLVVDVFAGSGTTGEVAQRLGRQWLLVEADPEVFALARKRLAGTVAASGEGFYVCELEWQPG